MAYKRIELDKPIFMFILVFTILFSYTVLTYCPPEQKIPSTDILEYEPIITYNEEIINTTITDNGTVLKPISVNIER